jgi:HD superfamily phosphohydrolase
LHHEDWTDLFVNEIEKNTSLKEIDWNLVKKFIGHKVDYKAKNIHQNLGADIVSSQLDADRLDYLLRDSHFSGVPYGNHNLEWIINNLAVVDGIEDGPRLGIYAKGIHAVEHFLLCRRMMTYSVYYHQKVVAFEHLFVKFLELLGEELVSDRNNKIVINTNLREFLKNTHKFVNDKTSNKCEFISNNFGYYKELTDSHVWGAICYCATVKDIDQNLRYLAEIFYKRNIPKIFKVKSGYESRASRLVTKMRGNISSHDVFFKERHFKTYKTDKDPLYIAESKSQIQAHSDIINLTQDQNKKIALIVYDKKHEKEFKGKFDSVIEYPES